MTHPTVRTLSAGAIAGAIGMDLKTIHNWIRAGKGPPVAFITPGRHRRFAVPAVAAWLAAHGMPVPREWQDDTASAA